MLNRFIRATLDCTPQTAGRSTAWAAFARDTVSGFLTTAHYALLALGIIAIATLGVLFVKPETVDRLKPSFPFAQASAAPVDENSPSLARLMDVPAPSVAQAAAASKAQVALNTEDGKMIGTSREQQWVTNWIAKRYRVATDATDMLVSAAYLTAKEIKIDPLLILSVMAIESRFNPFAESPVGAQGLMQVMSKVHRDKFEDLGGVKAALNPLANIRVGSLILKEYVKRGGSVEAGLKLYVGAGALDTDFGYGAKVLAEYRRLKDVAMGKKVSIYSPSRTAAASPKPAPQTPKVDATSEGTTAISEQAELLPVADNLTAL